MSSFNNLFLNENLDHVFNQPKRAAKVNLAFRLALKNIENGTGRYFYAHENVTVKERSNFVCTEDDMTKLEDKLQKMYIVNDCIREKTNTKKRVQQITNVTVFASIHEDIPWVVKML